MGEMLGAATRWQAAKLHKEVQSGIKGANLKAVDLFCGGGGISAGLRSAGFSVIAGADNDPKYLATFRHNFPNAIGMNVDLVHCAPSQLMNSLNLEPGELDILAGGPPVRAFQRMCRASCAPPMTQTICWSKGFLTTANR